MQFRKIFIEESEAEDCIGTRLYLVKEEQCLTRLHAFSYHIGNPLSYHMSIQVALKKRVKRLLLIKINLNERIKLFAQMTNSHRLTYLTCAT